MELSGKLSLLGELGIVDWLQAGRDDEHVRILVNALASDYYFADTNYFWFFPTCRYDTVSFHFRESGYDIDWYSLITLEFAESIKNDPSFAVNDAEDHMTDSYGVDLETYIIDWVREWCGNCRKAFIKELRLAAG